jgi:hypothetical protein
MGSGVQRNIFNWINPEGQGRFEVCEGFHLGVYSSILPYQLLPSSIAVAFCNQAMLELGPCIQPQIIESQLSILQLTYNSRPSCKRLHEALS